MGISKSTFITKKFLSEDMLCSNIPSSTQLVVKAVEFVFQKASKSKYLPIATFPCRRDKQDFSLQVKGRQRVAKKIQNCL